MFPEPEIFGVKKCISSVYGIIKRLYHLTHLDIPV